MSTTINPRHLNMESQTYSYRFSSSRVGSPSGSKDTSMSDTSSSPPDSLPGSRGRTARGHASNNKSLPRIDTEQLKGLSLREKNVARHNYRSPVVGMRQQSFQKYRELLWEKGRTNLGNRETPHFNIAAVKPTSTTVSSYDSITIYSVVHSKGHSPVGLRRQFDRNLLSATVPEPFQSPSTPDFDRDELLSAILDTNKTLAAGQRKKSKSVAATRRSTRQHRTSPIPDGIPIHFPYARSYLPVLAAILMSNQVRVGDTIELPVPHPEAWAETVAWVYIGEEELATAKVCRNVEYLGGRICSPRENPL